MGVYTFVCKNGGGEWTAKQHEGDLEASASSTFELNSKLVQVALSAGGSGGVQSSFSLVSPTSGVCQVIIGGGGGGGFAAGGAASGGVDEKLRHTKQEPLELVRATLSDPPDYYKKAVAAIIELLSSTGNVIAAASDLFELGSSEYHPYFIMRLVSVAMDRHDKEKELASVLLSALYPDVINPNQIRDGFVLLLESADDFVVDIPDDVDVLALFLARAVVDDILPPAFLPRATKALPQSSKGYQIVQTAEKRFLSAADHSKLVKRRWRGKTWSSVEKVKKKFTGILNKYVETGETNGAFCCIITLGDEKFHNEEALFIFIFYVQTTTKKLYRKS